MPPRFAKTLADLPAVTPFVGPETLERRRGRPYDVRVGANESAFGISPKALEVLRAEAPKVSWYCDPEHYDLREALAAATGTARENIVVGEGIDGLLGLIVRAFVDPGDAVVTSLGAYPTFNYHVNGYGGDLRFVEYREDFTNDVEGLLAEAGKSGAKLLYLANPDNPCGTFLGADAIGHILDRLPEDCFFVLDEAYHEFAPEADLAPIDVDDPRLIRLRTFSKAHGMAGLRVGYGIAQESIIKAFDKIRLHFGVGRLSQLAAAASLADQGFVASVIDKVAQGRRDYEALARDLNLGVIPSLTNFVAIDVESEERSETVVQLLHEKGVFVRRPGVPRLGRHVRVTVGTEAERAAFAAAFRDVMKEL